MLFTRWKIPAILHTHVAPKSPVTAKYTAQIDSSAPALSCHESCEREKKKVSEWLEPKRRVINSKCVQRRADQKVKRKNKKPRASCPWGLPVVGRRWAAGCATTAATRGRCRAARPLPSRLTGGRLPNDGTPRLGDRKPSCLSYHHWNAHTHAKLLDISHFPSIYILG